MAKPVETLIKTLEERQSPLSLEEKLNVFTRDKLLRI
jgi:hypothetical protein